MLIGIDASRAVTQQRTGTEAYAYFLIRALLPLAQQRGHRVRLYYNQPPPERHFADEPDSHVEHVVIPAPRLWTHGRLAIELQRRPPDVFFTPAHVIPFTYRGRSVATVHDLGYRFFPDAHTRFQRAYLDWSTRHNARRSHTVLADSFATKTDLTRFYGTPAHKIEVVYPGIDPILKTVRDEKAIAAVLEKHAIISPYLLYIGTLQPRKNLVRLIEAYRQSDVPHRLVLAGRTGWRASEILEVVDRERASLGERSSNQNRQSSIQLPGYIPESDKAALLSGATALLFPSLYEGFGFPVLEGMACETAVLSANSSSLPEVSGNAALLVDPKDVSAIAKGIHRLCNDATLRSDLVDRGKQQVKQFSWRTAAAQTLHVLERGQ